MIYRVVHRTSSNYKYPVSVGKHVACLHPRSLARQTLLKSELNIRPHASSITERVDYFGNLLHFFIVQEPHKELVVEARSEVRIEGHAPVSALNASPPWEEVVCHLPKDRSSEGLDAYEFSFESPRIKLRPKFASYACQSFTRGRPMIESLLDLTARIHSDFQFNKKVTNVRTTTEEVFEKRRGVCQDFAHFQIACLRSLRLSARYVSGYLRTYPPPGKPRLVGADASHAWVSAYCPGIGWVDVDPTNNVVPSNGHVTLAWGRDYGDVSPLFGLIQGGGAHTINVSVDLEEIEP